MPFILERHHFYKIMTFTGPFRNKINLPESHMFCCCTVLPDIFCSFFIPAKQSYIETS